MGKSQIQRFFSLDFKHVCEMFDLINAKSSNFRIFVKFNFVTRHIS